MDHLFTIDLGALTPAEVEVLRSLRPTVQVAASTLGDEQYIRLRWLLKRHEALDLEHPRTFSEKLQWLKLHGRDPRQPGLVDKLAVRGFVAERIGAAYLNELYFAGADLDAVDVADLPPCFIVKCTHGSQWNVAVSERDAVEWSQVQQQVRRWLSISYYELWREWVYAEIPPRVVVERLLVDAHPLGLRDYKVFCCNGRARFVQVDIKRPDQPRLRNVYDAAWNQLPCTIHHYANTDFELEPPAHLDRMLEVAEALAADFPFVRVDLFNIDGRIVFGEMTFFPGNGLIWIRPAEYDLVIGSHLTLPRDRSLNGRPAPAPTVAWALDELDAIVATGRRPVLFGGFAKELHGVPIRHPHGDVDVLVVASDIAELDELSRTGGRTPFAAKRHHHKRAYVRDGVLVELMLVVPGATGLVTDCYGRYVRRWSSPLDVDLAVEGRTVRVASIENLAAYDRDHHRVQEALFAADPAARAHYRRQYGTTYAPNRNPLPAGLGGVGPP